MLDGMPSSEIKEDVQKLLKVISLHVRGTDKNNNKE
jgi:hypothetical protein